MENILERLSRGEVLVADGAMGTLLFSRGLDRGQCPESLNLTRPEVLQEVATLYLDAGAEVIQTNTFGASPLKLATAGLAGQVKEINQAAVRSVRTAVGDRAYIAASCGPSGRILKPYGDTDPATILDSFERQLAALLEAGVDAICVETMTDLREAVLAIQAAKCLSPTTPVFATMTFDATPRGFYTIMGVTIPQATEGLMQAGADVVGSNCGNGIGNMIQIARQFRLTTRLPLLMQANAGRPELQGDLPVYSETPEFMADKARELVAAGVAIIGGCCGTTPEHIRAIRKMRDSLAGKC